MERGHRKECTEYEAFLVAREIGKMQAYLILNRYLMSVLWAIGFVIP